MSEKRKCKFGDALKTKYPMFTSGRNEYEAKCSACECFISVSNKGSLDLDRHIKSDKHKKCIQSSAGCSKVSDFFNQKFSKLSENVSAAEGTLAYHTVYHHHSYKSTDCSSSLYKQTFHDSDIAKHFSSAHTKTEAIINKVLAPHALDIVIETMKGITCFGLSTDGSNHNDMKLFPILIQYFDIKSGGIQTKVVELKTTPNETAETVSVYIIDTLRKLNLLSKCVAFSADNTNVNFGGISRKPGNNIFTNLQTNLGKPLVGVGCPAHILHNCLQHGCDLLKFDLDSIVMKIYTYFSIYTVRTEQMKDFCESVELSYKRLLRHSKTRWLTLFPAIERILKLFPALKGYFLSQEKAPQIIKQFFEDRFSECYLWAVHSLMSVFQLKIEGIQKEKLSIIEACSYIRSVEKALENRIEEKFLSLKVRSMLRDIVADGFQEEADNFVTEITELYIACNEYLKKWTASLSQFDCFQWMDLKEEMEDLCFESIVPSLNFIQENVTDFKIDDNKLFDQFQVLKQFLVSKRGDDDFFCEMAHIRWITFFQSCKSYESFSELKLLCEFVFALPSTNSNVERLFSLINIQWSDERNRLNIDSVKGIIMLKYNFKNLNCSEFYNYLKSKPDLLKKISSSEKY